MSTKPMHGGAKVRGCSHLSLGNFTQLFPDLPSWSQTCGEGPVAQCDAEKVSAFLGGAGGLMQKTDGEPAPDAGNIPAAYTFFAQFIDHDVTLDTTTKLHGKELDKGAVQDLPNLRSPSLDLDCVYGFGPEASPFQYDESQPGRLLVGSTVDGVHNPNDVPRNEEGRALIGDPRNDENMFVSQLQLLFLRFHNKLLIGSDFETAQREARFHYQAVVLYDFLKRVCHPAIYEHAVKKIWAEAEKPSEKPAYPYFRDRLLDGCGRIRMPVEFSVAAYRFGHSTVRSNYPVNTDFPNIELFDERFGTLGFGQVPPELTVDWSLLLDVNPGCPSVPAKAINRFLADELFRLPNPVVGRNASDADRSLAFRNILRGYVMGLPSGQSVAKELKKKYPEIKVLPPKAFKDIEGWECAPAEPCDLSKETPLFFYLMHEGGEQSEPAQSHLGMAGSAILMEVFGTMLLNCSTFLTYRDEAGKPWAPKPCIREDCELTLADIARFVEG
ncbi:MAG: peroxidase family protein [Gammaproteobacteria bacterium]